MEKIIRNNDSQMVNQRINKLSLYDASFLFWIITEILFEHTLLSNVGLVLFCFLSIADVVKKRSFKKMDCIVLLFSFFVVIETFVTFFGTPFSLETSSEMLRTLYINIGFCFACSHYLRQNDCHKIESIIIVCTLISSIFAAFDNLIEFGSLSFREHPAGIGFNPNVLAYLDSIAIVFCAKSKKMRTALKILIILLLLSFIFLSGTRKAIVSLIAFSIVYLLIKSPKKILVNIVKLLLIFLFIYLFLFHIEPIYDLIGYRFETLFNLFSDGVGGESESSRLYYINIGMNAFASRPLFGVGLNGFKNLVNVYGHPIGTYAHSNYVELLCDVGLIGTLSFYSMHIYILCSSLKGVLNKKTKHLCIYFALFTGLLVIDLFMVSYFDRTMLMLIILFGNKSVVAGENIKKRCLT